MRKIKKFTIFTTLLLSSIIISTGNIYIHAAEDEFSIIKKAEKVNSETIKRIGSEGGKVMEKYRDEAGKLSAEDQLASGIMNWNTIYNYLVFFVKYLSQLGLIVGVIFIMYAGYRYMTSVFTGKSAPTDVLSNAIIGVLIVIFSYAITKFLTGITGLS